MLKIAKTMRQLKFYELMKVYRDGNICNGHEFYPDCSAGEQLRRAEQDFYYYLDSVFFRQNASFYAVWEADGCYLSALRIEPYADGFLLCALETAPDARRHGYAAALISSVQAYLASQGSGTIYSHVSKNNEASLSVHRKCGFQVIKDYAVYSDGSVLHKSCTLSYKYEKSET